MVDAEVQRAGDHLGAELRGRMQAGAPGDRAHVVGHVAQPELAHERGVEGADAHRAVAGHLGARGAQAQGERVAVGAQLVVGQR